MKTLAEEIANGETAELEFKRDVPSEKLKLLKTAVAFANCNGGRIVVGVDDDRTVVGVDEMGAFRLADQLIDTISNDCVPQVPVTSEIATVDGKTVIVLTVQMGLHCPYYVKSLAKENGTFVRVGATSRVVGEDALRELEFVGAGKNFDSMVCRGLETTKTEIDRLCRRMYREARANCDSEAERRKVKKVTAAQLEDWGILVRTGNRLLPTHAFALLTGARRFHAEVKCGLFRGTTRSIFIDRKEFEGPVLDQIEEAFDFVVSKINVGMKIVGTRRHNVYEIPLDAIRELIVNAVVHRLYINPRAMAIFVALYDDRLEITSPGGLPHGMTLEMMMSGHTKSRNKALALAFRYMNIIEDWGSGIRRIQGLLADAGLKPLTAEVSGLDLRITIWRKQANDCGLKTVQSVASEKTEKFVLNEKKLVFDGEDVVLGGGNSTVNSTPGGENSTVCFGASTVINGYGSLSKSLRRLVGVLGSECLGSKELCARLGLKSRGALAQTYIRPALKAGLIMVVGGKTHSAQRAYRLKDSAKVNQ